MTFKKFLGRLKHSFDALREEDSAIEPFPGDPPLGSAVQRDPASTVPLRRDDTAKMPRVNSKPPSASSSHLASVQIPEGDANYLRRQEHADKIEAMFGDFGPCVCSYVFTQSLIPGGVQRIVEKIGLQSRFRDGADLAQVEMWLTQNGVDAFCEKAKLRLKRDESATPAAETERSFQENDVDLKVRSIDMKKRKEESARLAPGAPPKTTKPLQGRTGARPRTAPEHIVDAIPKSGTLPQQKVSIEAVGLEGKNVTRRSRPQNTPTPSPAPPSQLSPANDTSSKSAENYIVDMIGDSEMFSTDTHHDA